MENYPGFADVIQGPWLMEQMQKQAEHVGTRIVADHVSKVDLARRPFRIECDSGDRYLAESVIIATGAQARWLELPSEQKFKGYGVSACATCDGFFYRGKEVIVVGGGNTAVEEALFLTNFAIQGHASCIGATSFRAEKILQDRLFKNPKISVIWDSVLEEVAGEDTSPQGERRRSAQRQDRIPVTEMPADGVFIAIGHTPASELFAGQVEMKHAGYIRTAPFSTATSVPGVFAAGDVTDDVYRQAVTAAGQGCMAALEAERFLAAQGEARAARSQRSERRNESADGHGLGQAQGFPRRRRSRQLHACRRASRPVAIGGVAAGLGARAGTRRLAVPPPCPRAHPDRAGRAAAPHRA